MTDQQILLVLIAGMLANAIPAVRTFYGTQHDAEARARRLGAAVQGYTLRVVNVLARDPELSRDPEVREALLPTPAEAHAIQYIPSIAARIPEWRRGEGILSPDKTTASAACLRGGLEHAVTGHIRLGPQPRLRGRNAAPHSTLAEEVKP